MKIRFLLIIFVGMSLFQACSPREIATLYVPNVPSYHLMTHKGDKRLGAGFTLHNLSTFDIQAAYSPVNHLSIQGSFSRFKKTDREPDRNRKQSFGELGVGTYFARELGEKKKWTVIGELIGGYGFGKANDFSVFSTNTSPLGTTTETEEFTANSQSVFGQANLGFRYIRRPGGFRIQMGPLYRISGIHVYRINHFSSI